MQTFLPYPDFNSTARCLDYKRLGKQRVECKQIINALVLPNAGWKNHPAVKMWEGHIDWLIEYMSVVIIEWERRGYKNSIVAPVDLCRGDPKPPWLGSRAFHRSHKSNLLRKDPDHYGRLGWKVPNDLPYIWPV